MTNVMCCVMLVHLYIKLCGYVELFVLCYACSLAHKTVCGYDERFVLCYACSLAHKTVWL
jgi:hypothetical protein